MMKLLLICSGQLIRPSIMKNCMCRTISFFFVIGIRPDKIFQYNILIPRASNIWIGFRSIHTY